MSGIQTIVRLHREYNSIGSSINELALFETRKKDDVAIQTPIVADEIIHLV